MYFFLKKTASGQTLQLLEAYRLKGSGSPRHRVVVSLGDMPVLEGWYKPLAGLVSRRLRGELSVADADLPRKRCGWLTTSSCGSNDGTAKSRPFCPPAPSLRRHRP